MADATRAGTRKRILRDHVPKPSYAGFQLPRLSGIGDRPVLIPSSDKGMVDAD